MDIYSFDSDSFISAWRIYYSITSFPGVWECFDQLITNRRVRCAEQIVGEIERGGDELWEWVAQRRKKLSYPTDDAVQKAERQILRTHPNLVEPNGKSAGDPWVIALAIVMGASVVTFEVPITDPRSTKVKIPNVCRAYNIPCINVFEVIRREGWRFHRVVP